MRIFLLSVLIPILLFGCKESQYKSEIKEVKYLLSQLDSAETRIASVDTTGFDKLTKGYSSKVSFIQSTFKSRQDTMDRDLAFLLSDYRRLRKPYKQMRGDYEKALKELKFSREQLINLEASLEDESFDRNMVERFLNDEKQATKKVVEQSKKLESGCKKTLQKSALMEPKVDSVITVLKENT